MRNPQVIHLDQIVARGVTVCEFACNKCPRAGRLTVATLESRYGREASLGVVMNGLSADCPRRRPNQPIMELCGIHCPTLSRHS